MSAETTGLKDDFDSISIHALLADIQAKLHAPKSQTNNFGNYNYRSCEDILSAVKPLCQEQDLALVLTDEIENIGDRFYVKATAKLIGNGDMIEATALAREAMAQKGMSDGQLTGATSSYARKYALNGLFAIDDSQDDDTKPPTDATAPIDARMKTEVLRLLMQLPEERQEGFKRWIGCEIEEIEVGAYKCVIDKLKTALK